MGVLLGNASQAEADKLHAEERALALLPHVWYRAENGIQYKALIIRVWHVLNVTLFVLGDGDVPLVNRAGQHTTEPFVMPRVGRGDGNCGWSTELDT